MCDYSLMHEKSRPAAVGDKLVTRNFGRGTTGFASVDDSETAVCVLPGTEIAFDTNIEVDRRHLLYSNFETNVGHNLARFRQVEKENQFTHHDALELPDGRVVLLTRLVPGQTATVLQLPAAPRTEAEARDQTRLAVVG